MDDYKSKNIKICGLWKSKNGGLHSMPLDKFAYDALQLVQADGGRIFISPVAEEKRTSDRVPHFDLIYRLPQPGEVVKPRKDFTPKITISTEAENEI